MLTVNKYKKVLLSEFYLNNDDVTIHRNKDGWGSKYMKHDIVKPFILCSHGYQGVHIPKTRTTVSTHHLLTLLRGIEIPDSSVIDHIDGNSINNSRHNIRITTQDINCRNSKIKSNNTSGITGIGWNKSANCFIVRKYIDGIRKYLGSSKTLEGAKSLLDASSKIIKDQGYTDRHGI